MQVNTTTIFPTNETTQTLTTPLTAQTTKVTEITPENTSSSDVYSTTQRAKTTTMEKDTTKMNNGAKIDRAELTNIFISLFFYVSYTAYS